MGKAYCCQQAGDFSDVSFKPCAIPGKVCSSHVCWTEKSKGREVKELASVHAASKQPFWAKGCVSSLSETRLSNGRLRVKHPK